MKKYLFITTILYLFSYLVVYLVTLWIITALDSQMSGLFRWFVLSLAVIISGSYLSAKSYRPLSCYEKAYLVTICLILSIFFDNAISIYFEINEPSVIMGGFYFVLLLLAFNRILKFQWVR